MTSQQIKSFVSLRHIDQITRFESVSDEQIVRAYKFTEHSRLLAIQLLQGIAAGKGSIAIVGERGMGKSHMMAVVRGLANQPYLAKLTEDTQTGQQIQRQALYKISDEGVPTLTIGFDQEKGLNFLKAFPKVPGFDGEIPPKFSTDQIDDLIERRINRSERFALFIDGLSPLFKDPQKAEPLLDWLSYLAEEANSGRFCLIVTLTPDVIYGNSPLAKQLSKLFQIAKIEKASIMRLIDQVIFRKSLPHPQALESVYKELVTRMPHFTADATEFITLYPLHPVVLKVSPSMRRYSKTFSLFGFITAVASRAMVRRAHSLISLDDLFESFEFDLRKHPDLQEVFVVYDQLFNIVVPTLGQNHLYAKMILKSLLLLSLTGSPHTAAELADGVMLYDDRDPEGFRQIITNMMSKLGQVGKGILIEISNGQTRYIFRALSKAPVLPQEMEIDIPDSFKDPVLPPDPFPLPKQDDIPSPSALRRKKETSSKIPKITLEVDSKSETQEKELMLALERLGAVAISIEDSNILIGQTLISFGKRHFKDWPFTFDGENNFKDRVEVNVKWRGSLRKGIFKFGADIELRQIDETEEKAISEYDWQVMVFPIGVTTNLPDNAPVTLLAWQPASLTDEEILTVKHLLAARREGELLSDEQSAKVLGLLESEVAEVFERVYLQNGKLVSIDGKESSLAYQSSNFINIILAKLLEKPLAGRYPQHPKFEDLLDPEYVDQVAEWMFDTTKTPTPDQQMYLEQFARPLQLVVFEGDKYKVDVAREFSEDTAVGKLLSLIDKTEDGSISKIAAYRIVRKEPFGLQRPSLLMILAALVAGRRISLVDEFNEPIHTDTGLIQGLELGDFSSIHTTAKSSKAVHVATWKTRPAVPSTALQFSSKKVLIVDDDPTIHTMLELAAKPLGCKVEKAFDGIEALSILRSSQIDVVISDMRMPNMTGNELFFEMQSNPSLRKIPFIVLTSIDSDEEMAIALESGVEDYWIKPFRFQEVTARLKRLFKSTLPPTGAYAKVELPPQVVEVQQEEIKPIDDVEEEVQTLLYNQVKRSPSPPISLAEAMTDPQPVEVRIEGMTEVAKVNSSKSIPHPPIPTTPKSFESTEQVEVEQTNKSAGSRTDELAIPSVPAGLTKQIEFEVADKEKKSDELESNMQSQEGRIIFSIMLSNPESSPIDIMLLYNQFWDSCRRGNKSSTIPEYEEFKEMIISKARKLKKQFNCNDLVFSVKIENSITHIDCQVTRQDEYLKKQPKFRLI